MPWKSPRPNPKPKDGQVSGLPVTLFEINAMSLSRRLLISTAGAGALVSLLPMQAQTQIQTQIQAEKPVLFLIGDSTIRNGYNDNGETAGQFGWGHMLHYYFDTSRIDVVNDAMGGTSSRSFQTSPDLWPNVLRMIRAGDFVLMAFGHNDSRSTLRGNADETGPAPAPVATNKTGATAGQPGTAQTPGAAPVEVHSFGWYMREYIKQIRAKGATPVVLSLIPRNRWTQGKVNRNSADYALWARQAAEQEQALFIPLNDMIADRYDVLGETTVTTDLFPPNEKVHPNWAGASLNAGIVIEGLKALNTPLKAYLVSAPKVPTEPDIIPPAKGELGPKALRPATRTPL
jgi:rhamnogalacturonan acetylesterase